MNKTKSGKKLEYIIIAAMLAALTTVFTMYLKIPFGVGGYVHLGDVIIYLAASLLPLPYAMVAAAIGGGLADVLSGYAVWAPFSLVIKALLVVSFTHRNDNIVCKRNIFAIIVGILITVIGYYFAEVIIYGNWAAFASIPWNAGQAVASGVVYLIFGVAMDRLKLKNRLVK